MGVYEAGGRYQLYVDRIQPAGLGNLYLEFERLKARLEAEGLFAPERKRSLPLFPRRIGVVTSPTAAALRDILNVLGRRYPLAEVLLSPTQVQGDAAPPQIVAALQALNERDDVDVIIVARGGGSLEDLWAFNDERVARAVAGSRIPVICGVGHETDFSLADFSADVRAPTPSAAAELVAPDRAELCAQVAGLAAALTTTLQGTIEEHRWRLAEQARALKHLSPAAQLTQARQRVDDLLSRAEATDAPHPDHAPRAVERVDGTTGGGQPAGDAGARVRHRAPSGDGERRVLGGTGRARRRARHSRRGWRVRGQSGMNAECGRRISVIGTSGSGKTTTASQIARRLGIPHVELDALHWEADWTPATLDVFRKRVAQALGGDAWAVDGNYSKVRDIVWNRADTVVWLDYGLPVILWQLVHRTLRRSLTQEELWGWEPRIVAKGTL